MTNPVDGIITQIRKEDLNENGDYVGAQNVRLKEGKGEKVKSSRSNNRQKPRWGRFMQSLCCCVSPQRELEKPSPAAHTTNPSMLITQVQKNGNGTALHPHHHNGAQVADAAGGRGGATHNDYSQLPAAATTPVNGIVVQKTTERALLPQLRPADVHKKCLIIDLDETLVHSSFKPVRNADFVIPVEIDGVEHKVYVLKRPNVDEFLARVGEQFECVLFTASLAKYADPVADLLDKRGVFRSRLFREACVYHKGNYVKDLARLGRDLNKTLIIDNSPASYAFHPDNAIPVQTWFDDPTDVELLEILPLLERMARADSVYDGIRQHEDSPASEALLDRSRS